MARRRFGVWGATMLAFGFGMIAPASAAPPYFETKSNVQAGKAEPDGTSWFETWDNGMRFVVHTKQADRANELWGVLRDSYENGLAAHIRFDVEAAHFDPKIGRFIYPVCAIDVGGRQFDPHRACTKTDFKPGSPERQVAVALGQFANGSPRAAIASLDSAVSDRRIDPAVLKVALKARAESYETISSTELPESEAADRARLAALGDYRRVGALDPDDRFTQARISYMLQKLGDYAAARTVLEQMQKRWPEMDFNNSVNLAALERQQGHAEVALSLLNGLVERKGPQNNMRYRYHRGWTLNVLGRYDEAIADLSAGINAQPDYAFAYLRRACAYAGVGRLSDAATDLDSAAGLLAAIPLAETDRSIEHDAARARNLASALRSAVQASRQVSADDFCHGYWGDDDKPRARSQLLPG